MFETEVKRKIKREPAVALEPAQKIWFPSRPQESDDDEEEAEGKETQRDLVDSLWTFS